MFEDFRLKVFMHLASNRSFTKTAAELGVSQPAVSQNIKSIEKAIGAKLFTRSKGEINITEHGLAFKMYAEKILYWYEAASRMFGTDGALTTNRPVNIKCDTVVASYILPKALSLIYASHPMLNFVINSSEKPDIEISLSRQKEVIDFESEKSLAGIMEACVVASPMNQSLARAAVASLGEESQQKPFSTIAGIPVSNRLAVWSKYLPLISTDIIGRVAVVSDDADSLKTIVESSSGIAGILPVASVKKELASRSLLLLPVPLPDFTLDIHFVPSQEIEAKTICRLLLSALTDSLK